MDRRSKKLADARRLARPSPAETLRRGFSLMEFARRLSEAADRARR